MLHDRAEDVAFMADTGEHLTGAAARLGITRDALEAWCKTHAPDALAQLRANEPRNWNSNNGGGGCGAVAMPTGVKRGRVPVVIW